MALEVLEDFDELPNVAVKPLALAMGSVNYRRYIDIFEKNKVNAISVFDNIKE